MVKTGLAPCLTARIRDGAAQRDCGGRRAALNRSCRRVPLRLRNWFLGGSLPRIGFAELIVIFRELLPLAHCSAYGSADNESGAVTRPRCSYFARPKMRYWRAACRRAAGSGSLHETRGLTAHGSPRTSHSWPREVCISCRLTRTACVVLKLWRLVPHDFIETEHHWRCGPAGWGGLWRRVLVRNIVGASEGV